MKWLWIVLCVPFFLFGQEALVLSHQEKVWLNGQKEIYIGAMDDWAPINFVDYHGKASGIGSEIVAELNKLLKGKLKIVSGSWEEIYTQAKEGKIDAIMDITKKPEREAFFYFTKAYLNIPHVIVSRQDTPSFGSLESLYGKKVALEKNVGTIGYLRTNFPFIEIQTYDTTSMALHALAMKEVDAYIGNRAVMSYKIEQEFLNSLKIDALERSRKSVPLSLGVPRSNPMLFSILEKSMEAIPRETWVKILSKWSNEKPLSLDLTSEERAYLKMKKELRFVAGNEEWKPFSFLDKNGQMQGLEKDFLKLLESYLSVPIYVTHLPWEDALKQAKSHHFDGIISASPTPDRLEKLSFSHAYYISPLAVVTRHDNVRDINENFAQKRIAVMEGSAVVLHVKEHFPEAKIVYTKEGTQGLITMLLKREAEGAIDTMLSLEYLLKEKSLDAQVEIGYSFYSEALSSFQYALRKDEPLLLSIINKAIDAYSLDERKNIKERWESKNGNGMKTVSLKGEQKPLTTLSKEEIQWIKEHPIIKVSNEPDFPPFDFMKEGRAVGLGVDYMNFVAQKVGLHVSYVQSTWEDLLKQFEAGKMDVLQSVYLTKKRQEYAYFTTPFFTNYPAMAVRKGSSIKSLAELKGKKVALMRGYGTSEKLLRDIPEIKPIMCTNVYEALHLVSFGEADVAFDSVGTMSYAIMEQMLTNLSIHKIDVSDKELSSDVHFAVKKEKAILYSILQKALDAMTPEEHIALRSKWVFSNETNFQAEQKSHFQLSSQEKAWLKEHPILLFTGDPRYLPYEAFNKEGKYIGIVADLLQKMEKELGIHIEKVPSLTWQDALLKAKNKEVDMISAYENDKILSETHLSTKPYVSSPLVIVTRKDKHKYFLNSLLELENQKIAIIKDYSYIQGLKAAYPKLHYMEVENAKKGFEGVASGEYDAMVVSLRLATYALHTMGLHNLHVIGKTDMNMHLAFNVKKEWEPLVGILNKAIAAIPPEELQQILKRWGPEDIDTPFDMTLFLEVVSFALLALIALFYWNYLLKRQVASKTAELSSLLKSFDAHVIASKTDLKGVITYVSDAFCQISGYKREELMGKNHRISRHPDNDAKIYEEMWAVITHGGAWKGRIKNKTKEGGYYWVDSVIEQELDASGKVVGYAAIRHDVTAHVELEELSEKLESIVEKRTQDLAFLNKEQQAIFDSTSVGIVLLKERLIVQCNKRIDEMLGYKIGEQLNQSTDIWYREIPDYQSVYEQVWHGEVVRFEHRLMRKDGTLFWARLSGRAIDYLDKEKGVVVVVEDISTEKEALEAIQRAKSLAEEATQVKSAFLANMSHEIRTPMNAIIGMAHLALQTELSNQQRNYLVKIDSASKHLLGIINDILDFSKIEAGKMRFESIDFYLEDVMEHLADLSVMKAQEKGLELLFDIETNIPTALRGDPLRLGQILINLVNNAIKFTAQGEIRLFVKLLAQEAKQVHLLFEVHDTGIGIDEAQQAKLFEAFSQADLSTTREFGGSGLGLAICKHLVEMMQGKIWVKSTLGEGSTFSFSAQFELQEEQKKPQFNDEDVRNLRILIVDDNASAREILENILRSFHFNVHSVCDGHHALSLLKEAQKEPQPYNLVLIDWMMPQLNGIETIRKIREEIVSDQPLMFIMITAYSKEELQKELEELFVDGILIKPISPSTLLNTILNVLGKEVMRLSRKEDKQALYRESIHALRGAKVLLVEDNIINQEIAKEILEREGMDIVVANHGKEALEWIEKESFDGVLMDCQMPVMDGFEATRLMREGGHTLPILAMTANAMEGDKERCLACGMNDHISKPIDMAKLFITMAKWIVPSNPRPLKIIQKEERADRPLLNVEGLDIEKALLHVNNNHALLETLWRRFVETQAECAERIEEALRIGDTEKAMREAHTLKGLSGNIGARELFESSKNLEHSLKESSSDIPLFLCQTKQDLETVIAHLKEAFLDEATHKEVLDFEAILTQEALHEKLNDLGYLLKELDSEAIDVLANIRASLFHLGYKKEVEEMEKALASFDFEKAYALLKEIK
ncbi:transporter substrate-binding domain-containing protein [Sulfurospirillum deleyianum]|uniref:Sensory/regulatory protein RpfC n=1 Tax=Sulfurospirillum deleyianum (strain ATCC 51133 / DSM 6946 / 5175) TaxID=525898 RepID=D1B1H3_SULD5|nr:transporter substrate-binding domain-containing protein [Sulfurospirillum deleyianum]ACZ11943.1 PAS sensor protein [Sulfurospirillum deleyianum DSM 6946]